MNRMANTVNPIERYVDSEAFEPYLDRIFLMRARRSIFDSRTCEAEPPHAHTTLQFRGS